MAKVAELPDYASKDPVARMRVYQLARKLRTASLEAAMLIQQYPITEKIAGQLYTAVGSVVARTVEGYSRSSGRDRARIFEYALGSAREAFEWYESAKHLLEPDIFNDRSNALDEITRLMLAIIPRERARTIRLTK